MRGQALYLLGDKCAFIASSKNFWKTVFIKDEIVWPKISLNSFPVTPDLVELDMLS